MTTDIYVNDIGTQIILDTGKDLTESGINEVSIDVKKPDGSTLNWVGSVLETTKILYETKPNDLDQAGTWQLQAVIDSVPWQGGGRVTGIRVKKRLQG